MIVKAAVVQDSPVFFNRDKTLDKLESLVERCSKNGCKLVLFPESFVPGYPRGFDFGTKIGYRTDSGRDLYSEYYEAAMDLESKDLKRLEKLAKQFNVYLVVGITEKQSHHKSLYCSMVYVSPSHGFLGVHRKIKPTALERLVWAEGSGDTLVSFDTRIGKLGGLICWENYMPLARMSMYQKGIEVYLAPTADARDSWTTSMQHIALEGRCYVLACNQYVRKSELPGKYSKLLANEPEVLSRGGSLVVSPMGEILAGPLFDEPGILIADLDLDQIIKARMDFDVHGHYARHDIFDLEITGQPEVSVERDRKYK